MIFHCNEIERLSVYVQKQFERGKTLRIEPVTVTKTLSQVAYVWLVCTHLGQETGYTKDEIYQFCINKFPVHKEIEIAGEISLIPITLSKMTKEQASNFIDQLTIYFRSEGYIVLDPEDKRLRDLYNEYKERGLL